MDRRKQDSEEEHGRVLKIAVRAISTNKPDVDDVRELVRHITELHHLLVSEKVLHETTKVDLRSARQECEFLKRQLQEKEGEHNPE